MSVECHFVDTNPHSCLIEETVGAIFYRPFFVLSWRKTSNLSPGIGPVLMDPSARCAEHSARVPRQRVFLAMLEGRRRARVTYWYTKCGFWMLNQDPPCVVSTPAPYTMQPARLAFNKVTVPYRNGLILHGV